MSVLLVTFELKTAGKDYDPFFNALKNNSEYWWHYLEATWIVQTTKSAHEYANLLYPHMTKDDRLLVVKIENNHQGWLAKEAWEWLNSRTY
jgi:hypothetical protein